MRFPWFISKENDMITAAVKKSKITIIFLLFTLSAIIPPTGDSRMAGIKAHAVTVPYSVDEPVRFNKYNGNANLIAALPNKDIICPIMTNMKSFENNFCSIF